MKKIVPIIGILGVPFILSGCSTANIGVPPLSNGIKSLEESINDYSKVNPSKTTRTAYAKYKLSLENDDEIKENEILQDEIMPLDENEVEIDEAIIEDEIFETLNNEDEIIEENLSEDESNEISTLYSLSGDIDESCEDFCELKTEITNAIAETQNLIEKVKNNEIELTNEQRMLIQEQARQLKVLSRELSRSTTELSISVSDINQLLRDSNGNLDSLSLKYMLVLDNLVNGNEMMQNSLNSINMINSLFHLQGTIPPNNAGRILYGFQKNDEPPVVKDYLINENGEITENTSKEETQKTDETVATKEKDKTTDTYNNPILKSNIDTYRNTALTPNIDSFYNTALLDNNFMYGNGYGMGRNGMYPNYPMNPLTNENFNYNNKNTPNENTKPIKKERKKSKKLKKNIDTYRDESTPSVSARLYNIKEAFSNLFKIDNESENPIKRVTETKKEGSYLKH